MDGLPGTARKVPPCSSKEQFSLISTSLLWTNDLPRIRLPQPVIRLLVLPAVLDKLLKNAVFVSQAVAHGWKLQS